MDSAHLIDCDALAALQSPHVIVDCSFALLDKNLGWNQYRSGHIPAAYYFGLETEMSGPVSSNTGRHPLPEPAMLEQALQRVGVNHDTLIVAYDQNNGAYAARLWWLCHWLGHSQVALLEGGLHAWKERGLALEKTIHTAAQPPGKFRAQPNDDLLIRADELAEALQDQVISLVDARGAERFAGLEEPIDSVAGHVPGAVNRPFTDNLNADFSFKQQAELAQRHAQPLGAVHMCGSGVTACHNILASVHAGLPMPRLYPGSWSEWIRDPDRPVISGVQ